jgi:glucokinase
MIDDASRLPGGRDYAASLDVGGTYTKAALVHRNGQVVVRSQVPSDHRAAGPAIARHLADTVRGLLAACRMPAGCLAGVSISVPGVVDRRTELVVSCPNLQNWDGLPIGRLAAAALGLPVVIENDANLAALGERWLGAARGCDDAVCLTLGTGIGCGIILGGRLYAGSTGGAGELSHTIVEKDGRPCTCGRRGCLESYASGRAIVEQARYTLQARTSGLLWELVHGDVLAVTPEIVYRAAAAGDGAAQTVVDEALDWLGLAAANLINLFNPEIIVVGGGMAEAGAQVLGPLQAAVQRRGRAQLVDQARIVLAQLGNDAGVVGGAYALFESEQGAT